MKNLKDLIIKHLEKKASTTTAEIAAICDISRQAAHRHIQALVHEGIILKQGSGRRNTFYILGTAEAKRRLGGRERRFNKRVRAEGLLEDELYNGVALQAGLIDHMLPDAKADFHYAFTEMVNNAIEHSGTTFIDVDVMVDAQRSSFKVADTGIGIFENIRQKKNLEDEFDAIQALLKGKQTTMPDRHSGEGIFFTSKIADRFIIESHRKRLTIDNTIDDIFIEDIRFKKGTRVRFEISVKSTKRVFDLFKEYTDEQYKFEKSRVDVRLYQKGDAYVSRSQARRLLHALDQFSEIILDFKGISTVGQAFADEIFRVFAKSHPGIKIVPVNYNENIEFMIKRAKD